MSQVVVFTRRTQVSIGKNVGTGYVDALSRPCETVHCSHHYYLFDAERSRAKLLIPWQIKPFAWLFFSPGTLNCHISVTLTRYRPKIADNQYFIFDITPGYLPKSERNLGGECPELSTALPVHNPQKPLKINIISMSRRRNAGLSTKIGAEPWGRMPRTVHRFACPQSPKAAENQYYIHVAAAYRRTVFSFEAPVPKGGRPAQIPAKQSASAKSNALSPLTKQRPFLRGQAVQRISRRKGSRSSGRAGTEKSLRGQAVGLPFPTALKA